MHGAQAAANGHARVGRRRGDGGGARRFLRVPFRWAAGRIGAAVRPAAVVGEAEGVHHRYVACSGGQPDVLGEGAEVLHDGGAVLAGAGFTAEEGHDALRQALAAGAARHEGVGDGVRHHRPVGGVGGDADRDPAAEAAPGSVDGDEDEALVGLEAEEVRHGVGQLGVGADGDAGLVGIGGRGVGVFAHAADSRRVPARLLEPVDRAG